MRTRTVPGILVLVLTVATVVLLILTPSTAIAAHPDYQGTYVGVGTSSNGKSVPITVILRDDGDVVSMSMMSGSHSVKATSPEIWVDDTTLKLTPTVLKRYLGTLSGTGEITLVYADRKWTGTGQGEGTVLGIWSGSATGSIHMLTRAFSETAAEEWHQANPVQSAESSGQPAATQTQKPTPEAVKTVRAAAEPVAPADQLPISDVEKIAGSATCAFLFLLWFILSLFLGPSPLVEEIVSGAAAAAEEDPGVPGGSTD